MFNFSQRINQYANCTLNYPGHDYVVTPSAPPPPNVITPADISVLLRPLNVSKYIERKIEDLAAVLIFSKNFEGKPLETRTANDPIGKLIREPIDWDCVQSYVAQLMGHMDAALICPTLKTLVDKAYEHSWQAFPIHHELDEVDLDYPANWSDCVVEQLVRSHTWNKSI